MDKKQNKLGLYEKALPTYLTWEERLSAVKDAGYDFIEISIDETDERLKRLEWSKKEKNQLKDLVLKLETPILSLCLSGNRRFPIGSENEKIRCRGIKLIKDAVDFALDVGVRVIQLAGYDEYLKPSNKTTQHHFYQSLVECVNYAENRAVMLACETMENDLLNSIEKAMVYVKRINSPWFKIYPDVGNQTATGQDIRQDYLIGKDDIVAIHLKDTKPGIVRNIDFGDGTVDFASFFRLLSQIDYQGLFVIEMWTDETDASFKMIKDAREFILDKMKLSKEKN